MEVETGKRRFSDAMVGGPVVDLPWGGEVASWTGLDWTGLGWTSLSREIFQERR